MNQLKNILNFVFGALPLLALTADAQNVLTYHNDNARTGQNIQETVLTPANVASTNFGKIFSQPVDGYVFAQPLVVTNVAIPGFGTHNVVYVATEHDSVYAFDAASVSGPNNGLIWQTSLGTSAVTPNNDFGNRYGPYTDVYPEVGITSTPVIDLASGTIYLDAFTHEGSSYFHRIHALNITNGLEKPFSPVLVTATIAGNGADSSNGMVTFNPKQQLQRSALTLAGGILYVTYAGYADTDPYHGWVIGFSTTNLTQLTNQVFNSTPNSTVGTFGINAGEGGIWMSGCGPAVDAQNNLFLIVGNGSFNANLSGGTEYGDSAIRLATTNKLSVADFFTPYNQATLAANDTDFGSGGQVLLPDSAGSATHPHLLVAAGKEGKIYLIDRDNLGHFNSGSDSQIVQSIPGAIGGEGSFDTPAYFKQTFYYLGAGDVLKAFTITNATIATTPASQSAAAFGFPGATPSISANGTSNGIVWVIENSGAAILHAYNATNVALEPYNSNAAGLRDVPGNAVKFTVPTVANGKVYVGTRNALAVYGLSAVLGQPMLTNFVNVSPANGWIGYVNIFDLSANYQYGYVSDTPSLQAGFTGSLLTLAPNVSLYNVNNPYWVNPNGSGAKNVDANFYVESTGLSGYGIVFTGYCWSNTLVAPYNSVAFIKEFNPNYSVLVRTATAALVTGHAFNLSLTTTTAGDHIQYGFETYGPDANPATAASLGKVLVSSTTNCPSKITSLTRLVNGTFHFGFTNLPGASFTVFASTNLTQPFNTWSNLGSVIEWPTGSGQFQFTDLQAPNNIQSYYRVRSP